VLFLNLLSYIMLTQQALIHIHINPRQQSILILNETSILKILPLQCLVFLKRYLLLFFQTTREVYLEKLTFYTITTTTSDGAPSGLTNQIHRM
jgi:hypothetical protein